MYMHRRMSAAFPQKVPAHTEIPKLAYLLDMIRRSNGKAASRHNKYLAVGTQLPHKETLTARHSSSSAVYVRYMCVRFAHAHTHGSPTPLEVRTFDKRSRHRCQKGPLHTHLSHSCCKPFYAQLETVTCANLWTYAQSFVRVQSCQSGYVCVY